MRCLIVPESFLKSVGDPSFGEALKPFEERLPLPQLLPPCSCTNLCICVHICASVHTSVHLCVSAQICASVHRCTENFTQMPSVVSTNLRNADQYGAEHSQMTKRMLVAHLLLLPLLLLLLAREAESCCRFFHFHNFFGSFHLCPETAAAVLGARRADLAPNKVFTQLKKNRFLLSFHQKTCFY